MKIYTRKGDDGTTGLYGGGRVRKDSPRPVAYGTVDEAQAALGMARAECERGSELDQLLIRLESDLWVLMAELATDPSNAHKLTDGASRVTAEMVAELETMIDETGTKYEAPTEFVVPGQNRISAALDLARVTVRRAERESMAVTDAPDSHVGAYLNRLSDLCWTLARWQEGDGSLAARATRP